MIRLLWLRAVRSAWTAYIGKLNKSTEEQDMHRYLSQKTGMDMTLEEFGEMVFIEGFAAGEKYTKRLMVGNEKQDVRLN